MTRTHDELVAEIAQLNEWLDAVIDERDQAAKRERDAIVSFMSKMADSTSHDKYTGELAAYWSGVANGIGYVVGLIERGEHLREGDE